MGEDFESEAEATARPAEPAGSVEAAVETGEAPEQPAAESTESVLDRLDTRLAEAQRLLSRQAELTERLHAENQGLRAGELRSAQMPLVRDLIRLSDDLERMRSVAVESASDLAVIHESLLDILARNGIEVFSPPPGERFDPRVHSVSGTEATDDERLDKTVAEVVRNGFRWGSGEVVRVAEIRAYRATEPS
jgi:molecular chaperone GrpE